MRTLAIIVLATALCGCSLRESSNPGDPNAPTKGEVAGETVSKIGSFLPPPFNLIVVGLGGVLAGASVRRKKKE